MILSAAQRLRVPPSYVVMAVGAALGASLFAISAVALSLEAALVEVSLLAVVALILVTRKPRPVLLGLTIGLIPLDVKVVPGTLDPAHIGGASGITITAQFAMLLPLAVIALLQRNANPDSNGRLPTGAVIVPLIPIVAMLPSLAGTRDLTLGLVEIVRMTCFYLLYLYFALDFKPTDAPLVVAALLAGVLIQVPFVAAETLVPDFHFSIAGGESIANSVTRPAGTLVYPDVLAGFLALILPIGLALVVTPATGKWLRPLCLVVLLLGIPMLLLTGSRGSWLGFGLAAPLVVVLAARRGLPTPGARRLAPILGVAAVAFLLLLPVWAGLVATGPGTFNTNRSAILMWLGNPVSGAGLNTFSETVTDFDYRAAGAVGLLVPSVYLLWLAETGIVGVAGMALFLAWAAYRILQVASSGGSLTSLLMIGFAGGVVALYVGELASSASRFEAVAQALYVLLGVAVSLGRVVVTPASLGRVGQLRVV